MKIKSIYSMAFLLPAAVCLSLMSTVALVHLLIDSTAEWTFLFSSVLNLFAWFGACYFMHKNENVEKEIKSVPHTYDAKREIKENLDVFAIEISSLLIIGVPIDLVLDADGYFFMGVVPALLGTLPCQLARLRPAIK